MNKLLIPAVLLVGFVFTGCFSMQTASNMRFEGYKITGTDGHFVEHVHVSNYGYYLFNRIPLVCGNADDDAWLGIKFFSDHVTPEIVQGKLTRRASDLGANVADMNFVYDSTCMIPMPIEYVNTTFGILWIKEMQASGVFVKPAKSDTVKKKRTLNPLNNDLQKLLNSIPDGGAR